MVILPLRRWAEQAQQWRTVEQAGFDHAWTYDHLIWDYLPGLPWGATLPTLVAAAGVTSRIPLGTWVATPNFRHPVPFARELAALDDISGGRAVLGVGAGGTGRDSRVLGQDPLTTGDRAARLEEFVTVLDLLLTQPRTTWSGRFYTAEEAETLMPGLQQPRLPFVVAANGPRTMRLAARFGRGWATTGRGGADDEAWWRGIAGLAAQFEDACGEAGVPRAGVDRLLHLDSAPTFPMTSLDLLTDSVGRAARLGFTDVVVHWPVPGGAVYDAPESMVDEVAAALPSLQGIA